MFDVRKLDDFPLQPGVYLMKDAEGHVLYVGKSKNLRQRIKQYFFPGRDEREMIPFLVAKVSQVETIVVFSEKEALLLENNLIKEHRPRYNALFKDDKTYIAIRVTTENPWPKVELVRYRGQPKADAIYFGPYTSAESARQTLELLQKLFPLRQCSDQEFARRTRPCILYDMQRCVAPCVGKCTKEEYDHHVKQVVRFLKGQNKEVVRDLQEEMQKASDRLEFERANAILQTIRHIEKTIEQQHVDRPLGVDSDVFGIFREGDEVVLSQLFLRGGKLLGSRNHNFSKIIQDDEELLTSFILQYYAGRHELPHEILVPVELEDVQELEEVLAKDSPRQVHLLTPQKGGKKTLIAMAETNAQSSFRQTKDQKVIREATLMEMKDRLHLSRYPRRIECLDISHHGGSFPVAAWVAFTDGEKDKVRYRKYKIKTAAASDDYGAMREVLMRRYQKVFEQRELPDLLIIDGGKGHLSGVLQVLKECNIISVDVIAVTKEEGRHDKGMTAERVFLPNLKDPIIFKNTSPVLFMLQQIRDEAHRFAITFQRKRSIKENVRSALEDLPGIGPAKRTMLLRHFGSLKKLLEASEAELQQVPKLTKRDIETLLKLKEKETGYSIQEI